MKKKIHTAHAPLPSGVYSQAIKINKTVYLAGQIPLSPASDQIVSDDFKHQVEQVFQNMAAVCKEAGGSLDHIVKLTVYLTRLSDFPILNEVMKNYFSEPYPARTTIEVSALPKASLVEMDAILELPL